MSKDWVRVKSEKELRPGIWVRSAPCASCGRPETVFVVRLEVDTERKAPCISCGAVHRGQVVVGSCDDSWSKCFVDEIRGGHLFRLADHVFESETALTRSRETVGANERTTR